MYAFSLPILCRTFQLIPLLAIKTALLFTISFMCYHRMFVTTIDVTLRDYHRFEIPSVPRFFDLRNPRVLKDKEERTRLVSSFYFLRSLDSSPRLSIDKPSSYPTAALLDRRRDTKKEKETKKDRKRRTTGFGVSRGINDLVESIGESEIDRDDIERASSNLRSTTTLFLAMTPFAWLAIVKPAGGSRRRRNMKNREKRKNVTSSAKRIARWLERAKIVARKSHGDRSESKSGEGRDGREYKSKYFQYIDEYSNGRSTPSKSYWCDGTLSSSRGPFDADILPYSTFNGKDSFQEEHVRRYDG
ncbi:hypothetical protein HZH68_014888 [Vespula germanica]|uniref:Uncharacterized protein n=1 Tax=Vespula germanica TaxID=30212 RepID=A0A834J9Q5_VESGE|nr:hypothetical protein HZH68_014888 [Vespula germanica]